jgi:trimethylamine--corrinoid protein Co-methyltransferase
MEIVEYVRQVLKSEAFNEDRLMVDEIKAVGPGQSYIGRKSTFDNFKREYWEPELFTHSNLGQWTEMGAKSIRQYARELVRKKIGEHTYLMDGDRRKELDRIYECARKDKQLEDSYTL